MVGRVEVYIMSWRRLHRGLDSSRGQGPCCDNGIAPGSELVSDEEKEVSEEETGR